MKKILIAPLDWGLGHATRCIPVIQELLKRKCIVFLAGSGDSLLLLEKEFPDLKSFELPGYRPAYPSGHNMVWKMALQVPHFRSVIRKEHEAIESIVAHHEVDFVISDNRYGCWSAKVPSVIMTHQLNIMMPRGFQWLSKFVNRFNKKLIGNFSFCWIPDYQESEKSLSGDLSSHNGTDGKFAYVGPLSRFTSADSAEAKYDVTCIFSGPEPQRSLLEKKLKYQLSESGLRYFIVQGNVSKGGFQKENEAAFLNAVELQNVISQSALIIARSGYSTIMDLTVLRRKAILIPTPGQTEQEYLAKRWTEKGVFFSMAQADFNLLYAIQQSKSYPGFTRLTDSDRDLLTDALDQFLVQSA